MQNQKIDIVLVGGGGHCRSIIDVIEQQGKYNIIGIIDKDNIGTEVLGYKIIGADEDLKKVFQYCKHAVITVGQIKSSNLRVKLFNLTKEIGFKLPIIISPLAYVSKHSTIQEGTVVMHQALVNANSHIGKNCIINTKSLLEHDVVIGNHCHISTASILNGGVIVDSNTFVGSNVVIKENTKIGRDVVIAGGEKVMHNIQDNSVYRTSPTEYKK